MYKQLVQARGFVLVIAMLFLAILSVLALSVLEVSVLENKMSNFYHCKAQAFYLAERSLLQAEQQIIAGEPLPNVEYKLIDRSICGVTIYLVTTTAKYRGATSVLQSTVAKVDRAVNCMVKPTITSGRQSFRIVI